MIYTFADLQNEVLANLDETGSTSTPLTLAKNFINQAHQMRLSMQPWKFMEWDSAELLTCTIGQRVYPLHQEFWRPIYFFDRATKSYLVETPNRALASTDARWNDDTGSAIFFRLTAQSCVAAQPTSSSVMTIVSSSAADTTSAKAIIVRGVTTNGVTTETITPNGTTPVAGATAFTKILNITKSAAWAGNLTITSNGGAVNNLTLFPTEYGRQYQQIELLEAPDAADVIEYKFIRKPTPLVNDNDIPDLPAPHSHILVYDALILFAGYLTDVSPKSIQAWTDMQRKMEIQLAQTYLEGQSLETHPRYVRYTEGQSTSPRIFS